MRLGEAGSAFWFDLLVGGLNTGLFVTVDSWVRWLNLGAAVALYGLAIWQGRRWRDGRRRNREGSGGSSDHGAGQTLYTGASHAFARTSPGVSMRAEFDAPEPIVGEVLGYRRWILAGGLLYGIGFHEAWEPEGGKAKCAQLEHRRMSRMYSAGLSVPWDEHETGPRQGCQCGFWGLYAPEWQEQEATDFSVGLHHGIWSGAVFGIVRGWGRVLVGTKGWRAEYAAPVAILVPPEAPEGFVEAVVRCADRYGVPVVRSFAALTEFGPVENLADGKQEATARSGGSERA